MSEQDTTPGLFLPNGTKLPSLPAQLQTPQPTTKNCYLMGADAMMVEEADGTQSPRILLRLMAEDGSMVNAVPNNAGDVLRDLTAGRAFSVQLEDRTSTTALALGGIGPHAGQQVEAASRAVGILQLVADAQPDYDARKAILDVVELLLPLARPSLGRHYHDDATPEPA